MKTTARFLIAVLMLANTAHAANWQTPAAAMQMATAETQPAPSPTVTVVEKPAYFQITSADVAKEVSAQLKRQGYDVKATVNAGSPAVLHSANHPLKLALQALQIDAQAKIWQAQAYVMDGNKTETVKPVAGRFDAVVEVPVLSRQLRRGEIIEQSDISYQTVSERSLRKDTATAADQLVGQSPTRIISANRAIRLSEISAPMMIKKGQAVEMLYTTSHMSIRTTGEALEDGSQGALIRVKNTQSQKAISGRVVAAGKIEVNPESTL